MKNARGFSLSREFMASIVVFLVALPLCMGIALACGVPTHKGLLTGVIGGLVVGALSGCRLQVSGPAAGLTVTVIELVQSHGIGALGPIVALAGVMQYIAGRLKLGQLFLAVSPAVVRGMLSGIGVIIGLSQFYIMFDQQPRGSAVSNVAGLPELFQSLLFDAGWQQQRLAAGIGLLTIVLMLVWKGLKLNKRLHVPEALPAIALATLVAWYFGFAVHRVTVPESLSAMITPLTWLQVKSLAAWDMVALALSLALIASAETLLSASSVDQLVSGEQSDLNKELRSQGVGNLLCGMLGSLPLTGVIVRSKTNIEAGATTRLSSVMHGLWLVLAVALLPWLLATIPTCTLAALLVVTGAKLFDWAALSELRRFGWGEVLTFVVTVVLIVTTDLLTGVGAGLLIALARVIWSVRKHPQVQVEVTSSGPRCDVVLQGAGTFLGKPRLMHRLHNVPAEAEVHVDCQGLEFIDHAFLEALSAWAKRHENCGGKVCADWKCLTNKAQRRE